MYICSNCGGQLEELENFCPLCGNKISETLKSNISVDERDNYIQELRTKIQMLENQQNFSKNPQIEQLRREINELKSLIDNSKIKHQKKSSSNDGVVACCCFMIIIITLFFMFVNPFMFFSGF